MLLNKIHVLIYVVTGSLFGMYMKDLLYVSVLGCMLIAAENDIPESIKRIAIYLAAAILAYKADTWMICAIGAIGVAVIAMIHCGNIKSPTKEKDNE